MDDRLPALRLLRSYLDGRPPLPEGAEGCRDAYQQFQKKSRRNFALLVVRAVADRMRIANIRVGTDREDDDQAREIATANRLGIVSRDVHSDMLGVGCGYVVVQPGDGDTVEVLRQRAEQAIVSHDPQRPDKRRAGLLAFRDDVNGYDSAFLHLPGAVFEFRRDFPIVNRKPEPIHRYSGGWIPHRSGDTGLPVVPLIPFPNLDDVGEFERHTDLLDSINWHVLQRLVIIAMQAYRQRATKGDLPEKDESGNPIDYAEVFRPGPGALWQLPEGVDLWESAQADITAVLEGTKADLRDLAAITQTPMTMLMPDSVNQTAEGASFAREGTIFRTGDRIERARVSWAESIRCGLMLKRGTADVPPVEADFAPASVPSMAEKFDALTKAGNDVPWRTKMADILGYSGDKIDQMAAERAEDQMLAAAFAPPSPTSTTPGVTDDDTRNARPASADQRRPGADGGDP